MTTTINWPSGFLAPLKAGFGYDQPELNQSTEFDLGSRVRELFTDGPDSFDVAVLFTPAQWAYFQGFYRYTLGNGARWFNLPLAAAGTYESREARITSPPRWELLGALNGRASFRVQTRVGTTLQAGQFAYIDGFADIEAGFAALQALENFVNG